MTSDRSRCWRPTDATMALVLACALMVLYHLNGQFLPGNDAVPNLYLPISVLREGDLAFTPDEMPHMFAWRLKGLENAGVVRVERWDQRAGSLWVVGRGAAGPSFARLETLEPKLVQGRTAADLRQAGRLRLEKPDYYIVPSLDPERDGYIGTFGPGAGLTATPVFALLWLLCDDLPHNKAAIWYGGKLVAALCVSASGAVLFLALRRLVARWHALTVAVAYGTATCVWAVSSQTLWQSGPSILALTVAAYCLLRTQESPGWAAVCGLAAGWAVLCRPTAALVVMAIGAYLAIQTIRQWRSQTAPGTWVGAARPLVLYVLAGLPLAIWLGWHHTHYLGAPWVFPDMVASRELARAKIGVANVWAGSLPEGLAGLLISPSRGMLVYSPILGFAFWGLVRLARQPTTHALWPLGIAPVLILLVSAQWYDWPGGWSFGYRLLVDTVPLLALCGAPVAERVANSVPLRILLAVLLAWSIGVQVLGAFAYDVVGWNARQAYVVELKPEGKRLLVYDRRVAAQWAKQGQARVQRVSLDIDVKANRRRLWLLRDSQLVYYATHFAASRQQKAHLVRQTLQTP